MDPDFHLGSPRFLTTHWSMVLEAGGASNASSQRALAELFRTYWYPVYAFLRQRGGEPEAAMETAQGFFAFLLAKKSLGKADPGRGRFRTFLLAALKNYAANERRREAALKRGGPDRIAFSLDDAESRYALEPSHPWTAERLYERRWALTVIECALSSLRNEYLRRGKQALFDALKPALEGEAIEGYRALSGELGMSEEAVKSAAYRLRKECAAQLRQEVAKTAGADEAEDELARLLEALRA